MENRKILLIGLNDAMVETVASSIADKVDLYYLNIADLLEYSFRNVVQMKEICGEEYYIREERAVIHSVHMFENFYASIPYSLFLNYHSEFSDYFCVYLKIPKEKLSPVDALVYDERNVFLKKHTNYIIPFDENTDDFLIDLIATHGEGL